MSNTNNSWIFVQNILEDFPTLEAFKANPCMYLVLSNTGKLVTAEPEYYLGNFASWWTPTGSIHIQAVETLAYMPIDIPCDIMAKLETFKKSKNSRLRKILENPDSCIRG